MNIKFSHHFSRTLLLGLLTIAGLISTALSQEIPVNETSEQAAVRIRKWVQERNQQTNMLRERLKVPLTVKLDQNRTGYLSHFDVLPARPGQSENSRYVPVYVSTTNVIAAQTTNTHKITPVAGTNIKLTGAGVRIGIWDEAHVEFSHPEFAGASLGTLGPNFPSGYNPIGHMNHVAGTLAGRGANPAARGMAIAAKLQSGTFFNGASLVELASNAANLQVSNHSYGPVCGWQFNSSVGWWFWYGPSALLEDWRFGAYSPDDKQLDSIARANPSHLIVKSAGNDYNQGPPPSTLHKAWNGSAWVNSSVTRPRDGNPNGYDSIPYSSVAKNILTVGSINDLPTYSGANSVVHSSFSSAGPTDDGRVKPDVMGNGDGLLSAVLNNGYGVMSGTSMAAPNVAGTAALLYEHWGRPSMQRVGSKLQMVPTPVSAAFIKGLLIHTAREAGNPGPDYLFGWGLINAEDAARFANHLLPNTVLPANWTASTGFARTKLQPNQTYKLKLPCFTPGQPIKVTLIWMDPPGAVQAAGLLDPPVKHLVNDLDLKVVGGNLNSTFLPWVLNPTSPAAPATTGVNVRDNVEQVVIATGQSADYEIQISHSGALLSNQSQEFCVLWTNLKSKGPSAFKP
ncbi:MAG TPA: S8 family serine peptidase [Fimbriimonadaceae bacterium]|nr:S8 family serine peptidase [Fimbriimonadaceae bacterium]HRJ33639.1 S8 family serine peptidase [Fimbriimonadaceae bacterium]